MPPGSSSNVVVFDFDGTLVGRDSVLDFCFRYAARRPWRWLLLAAVSPLAAACWLRSTRSAASVLLWALTWGTSTRSFVDSLRYYAEQVLPGFVHPAIFDELSRHLSEGSRVVLATGSLPTLVRGLLRARGLPALPVAGSRLRSRFGGLVVVTHCVGRTKLRELSRRFGISEFSHVYTDSWADQPLMRGAREVTLVSPDGRTESRARALLEGRALLRLVRVG